MRRARYNTTVSIAEARICKIQKYGSEDPPLQLPGSSPAVVVAITTAKAAACGSGNRMLESRPPRGAANDPRGILLDAGAAKNVTRLAGKVALITGGGTGIGRAIALAFAREGAGVAVAGRRLEKIREVAREIQKEGGAGFAMECDVTRSVDVERAVKGTVERFGRLNVLVNNAGALHVSTVEGISEEEWDRVMTVNVKGPFLMSRAVLPEFRRCGGGAIVNTGAVMGLVAMKERAAYGAGYGGGRSVAKGVGVGD